jgi:hypothetical protein
MYLFDPLAELVSVSASVPDMKQTRKKEMTENLSVGSTIELVSDLAQV